MKKITNLILTAALTAGFSGILNAGNFESDLRSGLKNSASVAMPEPVKPQVSLNKAGVQLSPMGELTLKMVSVKGKMERADLDLWNVSRIIENKEGGSLDGALGQLMDSLKNCTKAAKEFNAMAAGAIAKTPRTPDTIATAKLLLANIAEYTDNDETIALIRFETIMTKYPAYKNKVQPHVEEYMKALEALGNAGSKVMEFSGPLQSE